MIPCIHDGKKTKLKIKFLGRTKELNACSDCMNVIKSSDICEVMV